MGNGTYGTHGTYGTEDASHKSRLCSAILPELNDVCNGKSAPFRLANGPSIGVYNLAGQITRIGTHQESRQFRDIFRQTPAS
ncbi:MAG: hypothetical protein JWM11_4599 [Planctomycetaceae bacterium]|nr:hypothetical protein [Planctomycetaceae bacterium]